MVPNRDRYQSTFFEKGESLSLGAKKAAAINDTLPEVHSLWSNIYLAQGEYDKAISAGEKAISLGPNNALCHVLLAHTMTSAGRFEEAIELAEKAIRLSPYYSAWY